MPSKRQQKETSSPTNALPGFDAHSADRQEPLLSHDRSYFRKAQEIILTPIVEAIWGKTRILEIYLNIAEFGNGIFGAQAAARYYFNKNAANLSRAEAIRLASILINPKKYQFVKSAPLINRRVNRISHDLNLVQIPQR